MGERVSDLDAIRAQAAAWLARLRSEERRPEDEAGFRAWLAEDEAHRHAFDGVNTVWEAAGALPRTPRLRPAHADRRMVMASAAALVAAAGTLGVWRVAEAGAYATAVGEQRRVPLEDGSLIILDTDSKVRVSLGGKRRAVELIRGRAHFEVARDAARPFVVEAAGRQVVGGAAFEVTRDRREVCVLALDGEVAVLDPHLSARQTVASGARVVLSDAAPRLDRPDIARVTAWKQGRAVFDNDTLAAAVAEMNRYSRRPIVIADAEAARLHVSGVYSTGDTEAFARSLATLLPLDVALASGQVTLSLQNSS